MRANILKLVIGLLVVLGVVGFVYYQRGGQITVPVIGQEQVPPASSLDGEPQKSYGNFTIK